MPSDVLQFAAPSVPLFDQVLIVGPVRDERPIPEDRAHIVSYEPSSCDRLHYAQPALATPHPTRAGFYFCGDRNHSTDEIGDVMTWERIWANIPGSYNRPAGTYAFPAPGLDNGTTGSAKTITAMSPSTGDTPNVTAPVFTSTAHGFTVGQTLSLSIPYSGGVTRNVVVRVTAVTTDTFTTTGFVLYIQAGPGSGYSLGTFTSPGTAAVFSAARPPRTRTTSAIESFVHALPGVTSGVTTAGDFREDPVFQALRTADSYEVDTLDTTTTTPSSTTYRTWIDSGSPIVAESGVELYLNIFLRRRTVSVRAV